MKNKKNNLIKKAVSLLLMLSLLLALSSVSATASNDIKVLLDGKPINFDVPPQIIDGRTMVPIRAIFEAMGANVIWNDDIKAATATKDGISAIMVLNSNILKVRNGVENPYDIITMDASPTIIHGRTLAPARYVAESFGYNIEWNEISQTVSIHSSKEIEDPYKAFYDVMKGYWQTWKYDDSSVYYLNNINEFVDVRQTAVTASYDIERNLISFRMEHRTEDYDKISVYLNLNYKNNSADVSLLLYPLYISGEGSINKKSFATNSVLNLDFSNSNRINSVCNQIVKNSVDLTLKIVEEFLIASKTNLRVKDLGFENFDANKISVSEIQSKMISFYDIVEKENQSPSSNSSVANTNDNNLSCYPGTNIPTFTNITGVSVKEVKYLENGNPVYIYKQKNSSDVINYWNTLHDSYGWNLYEGDDSSTTAKYEATFQKGNQFIIIYVYYDTNIVWVCYGGL